VYENDTLLKAHDFKWYPLRCWSHQGVGEGHGKSLISYLCESKKKIKV